MKHIYQGKCAWCTSEIWKGQEFGVVSIMPPYHEYDGQHYICNPEGHPDKLLAEQWPTTTKSPRYPKRKGYVYDV